MCRTMDLVENGPRKETNPKCFAQSCENERRNMGEGMDKHKRVSEIVCVTES